MRFLLRWGLATVLLAGVVVGVPGSAGAAVPTAGRVNLTYENGDSDLIVGDQYPATDVFGIDLPSGAKCPGDTAHDAYHVEGYISAGPPGALLYNTQTPKPNGWPLVSSDGVPLEVVNTIEYTGAIAPLPTFSMERYLAPERVASRFIPAGSYNVGIACSNAMAQTVAYWNATFKVVRDGTALGTWIPTSQPVHGGGSSDIVGWVLAGAVVVAVAFLLLRRRPGSAPRKTAKVAGRRPPPTRRVGTGA